jgi:hypothetical protein
VASPYPHRRQEEIAIDRLLRSNGLPTLDRGAEAVQALAKLVQDHNHFCAILSACDPALRASMYDSMRTYLPFAPYPLDRYVAAAGELAERKQLPVRDAAGNLHPYMPPDLQSVKLAKQPDGSWAHPDAIAETRAAIDAQRAAEAQAPLIEIATASIEEMQAKGHLNLTCRKCTRTLRIPGVDLADAIRKARDLGWSYSEARGDGVEVCPDCP